MGKFLQGCCSGKLTFEYEQDEDGQYAGSIEQIEDIVAGAETLDELRNELARHLIEYAIEYETNLAPRGGLF